MDDSGKRKYALLIALSVSVISAFLLLFLMICFSFLPIKTREASMFVGLTVPTIISLYLFPKLCQKVLMLDVKENFKKNEKKWRAFLYLAGYIVLYSIICRKEFESISMMCMIIFHYMIVSLGEEFTYRKFIINLLKTCYKTRGAVVISAMMFSFILHINEGVITNLLIRFPLGLVFGCVAIKNDSIEYTIVLHTIYNLTVLIL